MAIRSQRYSTVSQRFSKNGSRTSDRDALAFIEAAQIYDRNQQKAIVELVRRLKQSGVWSKCVAIYPFVGGTATSHKWNLKDPRDLDAAFRLTFSGGWTHNSNGAKANGTNGYGDTRLVPSGILTINSTHISLFATEPWTAGGSPMGVWGNSANTCCGGKLNIYGFHANGYNKSYFHNNSYIVTEPLISNGGNGGFILNNRTDNTNVQASRNAQTPALGVISASPGNDNPSNRSIKLNVLDYGGTFTYWTNTAIGFSTVGQGLTSTESNALYDAVRRYEMQLGRGYDPNSIAFFDAAGITDLTQRMAIDDLVQNFKQGGLWSKMKAIYPFVGGTATSHKFNLKDPRDLDAAFRLTFSGGWTHSSTGADPNGTNGYADTYLTPTVHLTNDNTHLSFYSREVGLSTGSPERIEISSAGVNPNRLEIVTNSNGFQISDHYNYNTNRVQFAPNANGSGFFVSKRTSSTVHNFWRNGVQISGTNTSSSSGFTSLTSSVYISSLRLPGGTNYYSEKECAFATIGDGLTDADVANMHAIVQSFQTLLGRQV